MLYAFTSCGWFFADPAGVETVIVLRQAARAVELAERALGERIEPELLALLADVRSNVPAEGDGARIWRSHVRPAAIDARRMAAVYATRALAGELPERTEIGNFACERVDHLAARIEDVSVVVGIVAITDRATATATRFEYAAVDRRALHLTGGVREATAATTAARPPRRDRGATAAGVRRRIDDAFPGGRFDLDTLPSEERAALVAARLPTAIAAIAKFAGDPHVNTRSLAYVERAVELADGRDGRRAPGGPRRRALPCGGLGDTRPHSACPSWPASPLSAPTTTEPPGAGPRRTQRSRCATERCRRCVTGPHTVTRRRRPGSATCGTSARSWASPSI